MNKMVIIINGKGGVGKDTLCGFANSVFKTKNISAITPIKNIASQYGWKGEKDSKSRKFLADLKQTFIDYNDLPYNYLVREYEKFLCDNSQILFVHIRERNEINKFKQYIKIPCITLLVHRDNIIEKWGNKPDDNVEDYPYDFIYNNNLNLEDAKKDFIQLIQNIWNDFKSELNQN